MAVETEAPLAADVEIGVFAAAAPGADAFARDSLLLIETRTVRSGAQVFRFVTDTPPTLAAIDPYGLYIDRDAADNAEGVELLQ